MARPKEHKIFDDVDAVFLYEKCDETVGGIAKLTGKHPLSVRRYLEGRGVKLGSKSKNKATHVKNCKFCESEFSGFAIQKYCSTKCTVDSQNSKAKKNIPRYLIGMVKQRVSVRNKSAKQGTLELTIDEKWVRDRLFEQNWRCAITGVKMKRIGNKKNIFAPSIDRISSKVGYVPQNCQIVCIGAQYMKNDFSKETVNEFLNKIVEARSERWTESAKSAVK